MGKDTNSTAPQYVQFPPYKNAQSMVSPSDIFQPPRLWVICPANTYIGQWQMRPWGAASRLGYAAYMELPNTLLRPHPRKNKQFTLSKRYLMFLLDP